MKVDIKNATITMKDGASHSLEVKVGEGNVTFTEHKARKYELDKGNLDTVRNDDQAPVDVSLEFSWEFLTADTGNPPTPVDALKRRGEASDWISSSSDACEPYAIDIEILNKSECDDGTKSELILLADFRYEELGYDLTAGQISVTGKCNITDANVTRVAAS